MVKKIQIIISLAVIIVVGSLYFFSEQKENLPPLEKVATSNKKISVYISGQVKNPAVVTFEDNENLKVVDAVNAAGGLTEFADTEIINLAEPLSDGQHVHIPTKKIILQETSSNTNINTADEDELQKIKGVGPSIAKRIIDFRETNGDFQTIEDIKKVRGIGEKTFEKMKDFITTQ